MIRWGIVGTGHIAGKFADTLKAMDDRAMAYGVASRNYGKAYRFVQEHDVEKAYECYEQLLGDPKIDAVYVASIHPVHLDQVLAAMRAGKHVLCEKPVGMNAAQVEQMIQTAYDCDVFFMENMVTRFLPVTRKIFEWVDEGRIGEVRFIEAKFGFPAQGFPDSRWFHKESGGGALLDVGIYPINYATMILGFDIEEILSRAYIGEAGADEHHSILLSYRGGRRLAQLSASVVTDLGVGVTISGEYGKITSEHFTRADRAVLNRNFEAPEEIYCPHKINGFEYVIEEACKCIMEGENESKHLPWVVTLENMRIMDQIRQQWQLTYSCE